jgi:hypothetical protein
MSRSGATQFIIWYSSAVNSSTGFPNESRIYRSLDYGVTWSLVSNKLNDDLGLSASWDKIECDATGRFVMATRRSTSSSQFPRIARSEDYGATWLLTGGSGLQDIWVSGTGQFFAGIAKPYAGVSSVLNSNDYGRTYNFPSSGTGIVYSCFGGSADGSILVMASRTFDGGDGVIRIARSGVINTYDRLFIMDTMDEALWYSGVTTTTSDTTSVYLDDFGSVRGKIDLTQFDIRYEMDILWNYTTTPYPPCWIGLGLNQVQASSAVANPTQNNAQTTWTNLSQTTFTGMTPFDQVFTSRFYCGYSGLQGTGIAYRYRTTMKGNISLVTRQTLQFLNDVAMNSRLIQNDFECNSCLLEPHSTANQLKIFSASNANDGQQTQRGVAVWEASYDNLWNLGSAGSADLNSGVYRLYLRFTDTGTTNVFRGAQIRYSIYRVRK